VLNVRICGWLVENQRFRAMDCSRKKFVKARLHHGASSGASSAAKATPILRQNGMQV